MTVHQTAFSYTATNFQSRVALITPDIAQQILQKNTGNRRLRPGMAERWARIIRDGQWKLSPHGIVIAKSGRLLDGQHRLTAVVMSGIAVMMNVVENVDEEVFEVIDRGAPRSTADALSRDKKHVEVASFIARMVVRNSGGVSDHKVAFLLDQFAPEIEELHEFCKTTARTFSAVPFRTAAVLHMVDGANADYAKNTYRNMVLGKLTDLDPAAASLFFRGHATSANREDLLCRAWRAFDESKAQSTRVQIKNTDVVRAEMVSVVLNRIGADGMKKLLA